MLHRESYIAILANDCLRDDQRRYFTERLAVLTLEAPQPHPELQKQYDAMCEVKTAENAPKASKTVARWKWQDFLEKPRIERAKPG